MTRILTTFAAIFAIHSCAHFAAAHPGHGNTTLESTPLHWLEPEHAIVLLAIAAAVGVLARFSRKRR